MKKLLLGSTALVAGGLMAAPAMAADPIKMGVGGYWTGYVLAGSIDSNYALDGSSVDYKGVNLIYEGEIHFIGSTKLDNGTTVGVTVELEAHNPAQATAVSATAGNPQSTAAQIDESFMFAFGDWGRVEFGSRDTASYRMFYGTPSALIGFGFVQHNHQWSGVAAGNAANRAGFGYNIGAQWQDTNRINYFTPRFAGLQIGVSYAPKIQQMNFQGTIGGGPLAGSCGYNNGQNSGSCPVNDWQYQDQFDIGANYLNKFGDVAIALHAAYAYANFNPGYRANAAANLTTGFNRAAWKQAVVGMQVGFAGFTLGVAAGWDNNGLGANYYTGVDNDTRYMTAGIMYETGPWQMSAGWGGSRNTNGNGSTSIATFASGTSVPTATAFSSTANAFSSSATANGLSFGQLSADKYEVGANYALGPGVKLVGGFMYYSFAGPNGATSGNSWAAVLGMDFRF